MTIAWRHNFDQEVQELGAVAYAKKYGIAVSTVYVHCKERGLLPLGRIRPTGALQSRIRDTGPDQPEVDPIEVARALGAEVLYRVDRAFGVTAGVLKERPLGVLKERPPRTRSPRTHCKAGHELSGANLYVEVLGTGKTKRRCRACARERNKRMRDAWKESRDKAARQAGELCCYQDRCENVPFGSVGGLECRSSLVRPAWVSEADWPAYRAGYVECARRLYGEDWATCGFHWTPALTLPGKEPEATADGTPAAQDGTPKDPSGTPGSPIESP